MMLLLSILTCGIYGVVTLYRIGEELNRHHGKGQIDAGMDILLLFVTCGLWSFYVMYKYPQVLREITLAEEMPPVDVTVLCVLLTGFGLFLVALAVLQSELNRHWEAHRLLHVLGR